MCIRDSRHTQGQGDEIYSVIAHAAAHVAQGKFHQHDDRRLVCLLYTSLSVCGLGINDLLMWLMVDSLYIDYRLSKIVVTVVVAVWNFVTRKIFLAAHD